MPTQVDFEYQGNSAGLLNEFVSKHNKDQVNFELNLRQYKQTSEFKANEPFIYPAVRAFRPESCLNTYVQHVKGSNYDAKKNPFKDKFVEPNSGAILHTCESKSPAVYRNAEWMAELRGDRAERVVERIKREKRNARATKSQSVNQSKIKGTSAY